jgi:hypothetical protein
MSLTTRKPMPGVKQAEEPAASVQLTGLRRVPEYDLVEGLTAGELARRVTENRRAGWIPQGGIAIDEKGVFYQAMIRGGK